MLKKLRIGRILILILIIILFYITKNYNFLIPMMIMIFINTILDMYGIVKYKKYKTYKWFAIVNLIVGLVWVWIIAIFFMMMKEIYTGDNFLKYSIIANVVFIIVNFLRSYLGSERFKVSDKITDKNI